jgi:hypothetical protein
VLCYATDDLAFFLIFLSFFLSFFPRYSSWVDLHACPPVVALVGSVGWWRSVAVHGGP